MTRPITFADYKSSIVELKNGINESVSSLELRGGELIDCKNYMIAEGGYGGYISTKGYERIDGAITPSLYQSVVILVTGCSLNISAGELVTGVTSGATATALADGVLQSGSFPDGDAVIEVELSIVSGMIGNTEEVSTPANGIIGITALSSIITGGTDSHNRGITHALNLVQEVPGEGMVLGLTIFEFKIYVWRKKVGINQIGMYIESPTGWLEIDTSADPIVYSTTVTHTFKFAQYNFYAATDSFSLYWVDGVNKCRAYDGTTVTTIVNTGMGILDAPINIACHNFHLFLAYRGGSLQHSVLGDPAVWDATVGASEIGLGAEVTNLVAGVSSSLIIYLGEAIRVLQGNSVDDWVLEVFSDVSGAYAKTARRLLGTVFSVGDRGLSTLQAVQEFGDYAANSISQRFKQTLFSNKNSITSTAVSRDLNQYRIFFENKTGIYVSFEGKELRGATFVEFPDAVTLSAQGETSDQVEMIVFASNDEPGFIFKMDSGNSFDGNPILCRMSTAFYHYGSPRQYKAFKRATFEINAENNHKFSVKVDFDYNELGSPRTIWYNPVIYAATGGAIYGEGVWGTMKYGVSQETTRVPIYLQGVGTNMSYKIISNETYKHQHIIQNIITDYSLVGRRI